MKNLYNPFEKYSGNILLLIGIAITIAGSVLGYLLGAKFDSILHISFMNTPFIEPFIDNAVNIALLFTALYIVGYFINKKTRVIDILTTALISRGPFYLAVLVNINGYFGELTRRMVTAGPDLSSIATIDLIILLAAAALSIVALVWSVALLYNGFKVATNLKKTIHKAALALGILIADVISIYIIYLIN